MAFFFAVGEKEVMMVMVILELKIIENECVAQSQSLLNDNQNLI